VNVLDLATPWLLQQDAFGGRLHDADSIREPKRCDDGWGPTQSRPRPEPVEGRPRAPSVLRQGQHGVGGL